MLQQLTDRIRAGGLLETEHLAAELGAPRKLVEAMLGHLERQGVIQLCADCSPSCDACTVGHACAKRAGGGIRLWRSLSENSSHQEQPQSNKDKQPH
jgi:hypothetical protein